MNSIIYYERDFTHLHVIWKNTTHTVISIPLRLNPALPLSSFRQCKKNTVLLLLVILAKGTYYRI